MLWLRLYILSDRLGGGGGNEFGLIPYPMEGIVSGHSAESEREGPQGCGEGEEIHAVIEEARKGPRSDKTEVALFGPTTTRAIPAPICQIEIDRDSVKVLSSFYLRPFLLEFPLLGRLH